MTLARWVEKNREGIDAVIAEVVGSRPCVDDQEREQWVANDEVLYQWALRDGVEDV